jgi:hypothetical protein
MILKGCISCQFHNVKVEEGEKMSHCSKENCWARFSKCVSLKALDKYLETEKADRQKPFSALSHLYRTEK